MEVEVGGANTEECLAHPSKMPAACRSHHKRSKSASDGDLGTAEDRTSHCMDKDHNSYQDYKNCFIAMSSKATPSSFNENFGENTFSTALNSRVSLEDDIQHLQIHLHQEKSIRLLLERAIGRGSGTLSAGHRHFSSQTRRLIEEIEFLEEEIANREQQVLSLYRSMFDQCDSETATAQNSGMRSPVHKKIGARKHPSIIASSFCSSKKYPLQPLQVPALVKENGKTKISTEKETSCPSPSRQDANLHIGDSMKTVAKKNLNLARNLKDHLCQCPSRISEEMVRCMSAIYLCSHSDSSDQKHAAEPASFLRRTSTSNIISRRSNADEKEHSNISIFELSSMQCKNASYMICNYRLMVEQLETVDVNMLGNNEKLAFWINIYNALLMHAYLVYGIPNSSFGRIVLINEAAYNIGGQLITAKSIEHSILHCRAPQTARWLEFAMETVMRKKCGSAERQLLGSKCCIATYNPLVLFALCTGSSSDPMLRLYTAKNITEELEKAKKEFLQHNVLINKSKKVLLPKALDRYAKEVSMSYDDLLTWVSENVDMKLQDAIQMCKDAKPNRKGKASKLIEWLPYSSRFGYVISKDLHAEE